MNKKKTYYSLIWKKGLLVLPRFLLALLGAAAVVAAAAFAMIVVMQNNQILRKIDVGIVIKATDLQTGIGTRLVEQMESVKSVSSFHYVKESDAEKLLRSGELQAVVYLTENIYDDINNGVNTPVRVQLLKDSDLGSRMFRDLMDTGISLLQTGQSAVFAFAEARHTYEYLIPAQDLVDETAAKYLALALSRGTLWSNVLVSAFGQITSLNFYTMTVVLSIVTVLFGIGFAGLYDPREKTADICLRRMGIGIPDSTCARLLTMTAVLYFLLLLILVPVSLFTDLAVFSWQLIPGLLPLAFSIGSFIHLIYSFFPGEAGSFLYLIIGILLFLLGGGLFPAAYLPAALQRISSVLPVSFWQKYLADLLFSGFRVSSLPGVCVLGAVLTCLGSIGMYFNEQKA